METKYKSLIILGFLLPALGHAQVITRTDQGQFSFNIYGHSSPYCESVTLTGGGNPQSVMFVGFEQGNAVTPSVLGDITGITWNGVPLTLVNHIQTGTYSIEVLWELGAPDTGSHNLCVSFLHFNDDLALPMYSVYNNVNATAIPESSNTSGGSVTTVNGAYVFAETGGSNGISSSDGTQVQHGDQAYLFEKSSAGGPDMMSFTGQSGTVLTWIRPLGGSSTSSYSTSSPLFLGSASSTFESLIGIDYGSAVQSMTSMFQFVIGNFLYGLQSESAWFWAVMAIVAIVCGLLALTAKLFL